MSDNNDGVGGSINIISKDLRLNWEKSMIKGRSLLQVLEESRELIKSVKKNKRRINYAISIFIISFIVLIHFVWNLRLSDINDLGLFPVVLVLIFLGSVLFADIYWMCILDSKLIAITQSIMECSDILNRFTESVRSLKDSFSFHQEMVITEVEIIRRLVYVASMILSGKMVFESCRIDSCISRGELVSLGNTIERYERTFDSIWRVVTNDFGLVLDKRKIFERAERELEKDNQVKEFLN